MSSRPQMPASFWSYCAASASARRMWPTRPHDSGLHGSPPHRILRRHRKYGLSARTLCYDFVKPSKGPARGHWRCFRTRNGLAYLGALFGPPGTQELPHTSSDHCCVRSKCCCRQSKKSAISAAGRDPENARFISSWPPTFAL
jgi:hypothetical protein